MTDRIDPDRIDPAFRALPLARLADAALGRASELGAEHADVRVERICRQSIAPARRRRDRRRRTPPTIGLAVRVVVDGVVGLRLARRRSPPERGGGDGGAGGRRGPHPGTAGSASGSSAPTSRCTPERVGCSDYAVDPFTVPTRGEGRAADRLVAAAAGRRRRGPRRRPGSPSVRENKFYADLAGTSTLQQRVRHRAAGLDATTVDRDGGGFETMSIARPAGRPGLGVPHRRPGGTGTTELARLPELLAEKAEGAVGRARPVRPGDRPDQPVADHPRVGRARHRVRPGDRLRGRVRRHQLRHAGPARHAALRLAAHARHRRPHRPARAGDRSASTTTASPPAEWDLVRDGMLVGYQLDRTFAPRLGLARSNGCAFADSPHHVPHAADGERVAAARPAADRTHGRPDRRRGRRDLRRRATSRGRSTCSGTTSSSPASGSSGSEAAGSPGSCATSPTRRPPPTSGGRSTASAARRPGCSVGAMNCGKAQPGQVAAVSHGCPSALFRRVNVLNTGAGGECR